MKTSTPQALSASAQASAVAATTTFYERTGPTRVLRWAFSGLQRLWPNVSQRLAKRVFLTPLPLKWQQRRGQWTHVLSSGQGTAAAQAQQSAPAHARHWQIEHWPFERASITLYRTPHSPSQPTAVLLPGWGGNAAQMQPLALALHNQGWAAVIVEPPGHGRSRGLSSSLAQFERALSYVHGCLMVSGQTPRVLLAHSLGASAAANAVARGLSVDRLVLLAAPDAPQHFTHLFAQVFGLRERNRAAMQARVEAQEAILMAQFDAAHTAPRIHTPTLVLHDKADPINPFVGALRMVALLPSAQLHATEGLGHRRILKDAAVHQAVLAFVGADL